MLYCYKSIFCPTHNSSGESVGLVAYSSSSEEEGGEGGGERHRPEGVGKEGGEGGEERHEPEGVGKEEGENGKEANSSSPLPLPPSLLSLYQEQEQCEIEC